MVTSGIWPIILSIQWQCAALSQSFYECNKMANAHWSVKKRHPQWKLLYLRLRSCAIWSARPAFTEDYFSHCDLNKNWIRPHLSVYGTYSWYRFIVINHQIAMFYFFNPIFQEVALCSSCSRWREVIEENGRAKFKTLSCPSFWLH